MSTEPLEFPVRQHLDDNSVEWLVNAINTIVKPIVRRKLHASLRETDTRGRNQDALELVGDIRVRLLAEMQQSRELNGGVRDIAAYAAAISSNACYQYLRARFPQRTRLRNKLRYILTHDKRFALWKTKSDRWLCGISEWNAQDVAVQPLTETPAVDIAGTEREVIFSILDSYFSRTGGPVLFDSLVNHLAVATGLSEASESVCEVEDLHEVAQDRAAGPDQTLELRIRLSSLWNFVRVLQPQYRKALLMNLRDGGGDNLLAALPLSGVATIREIASALEMPLEELVNVWNSLPWDDMRIADHMGLTRQQVINLRQTARAKLTRWKKETGNI